MSLANQLDKEVLPYLNGDYFPACENLKALYFQDRAVRSCHLESFAARRFFGDRDLPTDVGHLIRNGFLQGFTSRMITGSERVSEYFSRESRIIPELSANPGTYSMLERVYSLEGVEGPFDRALVFSRSAQAVRNRLNATIGFLARNLKSMIRGSEERLLVINLGAGTARDTTEVSRISGLIERNVKFDNVDLDPGAVEEGRRIARKAGVANAEFLEANMFGLRTRYRMSRCDRMKRTGSSAGSEVFMIALKRPSKAVLRSCRVILGVSGGAGRRASQKDR